MGHILEWQTAVHLHNVAALSKSQTDFPKKGKNDILRTRDTNPWGSVPGVAGGLGHSGW